MDIAKSITETRVTLERNNRLEWNEKQMTTAANTIASSLRDIHEKKLWEGKYASFEDYCQRRWGMTRQRAHQMIGAENVRLMLADVSDPEVSAAGAALNDLQASELVSVPEKKRVEVMKAAISAPGKMTARKIKLAKARVIPDVVVTGKGNAPEESVVKMLPRSDAAKVCPHCHRPMP